MAFSKKQITLVFTLGTGSFGETGSNQVTVSGLRISAKITQDGGPSQNVCQLRVFGLPPNIYNTLTAIYPITTTSMRRNIVQVQAGDTTDGASLSTVFIGQIVVAQIDLNSQPDAVLNIIASSAALANVVPVAPLSYPNGVSVANVMQSIATSMGLVLENNGVTAMLPKSYFPGTASQQIQLVVKASGIGCNNGDGQVLAIWPKGGTRATKGAIPVISYEKDMIGYPSYSNIGIGIKCLYRPDIVYASQIRIASSLTQIKGLNGLWAAYNIIHTLESEMPEGQWMTEFQGFNPAINNQ